MQIAFATKEQFFACLRMEPSELPDGRGAVRIRELTAAQVQRFAAMHAAGRGRDGADVELLAGLVATAIIDADGARVFADSDAPAILETMPLPVIVAIGNAVARLSGMSPAGASPTAADSEVDDAGQALPASNRDLDALGAPGSGADDEKKGAPAPAQPRP